MSMKQFRVDILGEGFDIKTDAPEEFVLEIAKFVDEKMREAVSEGRSPSREKAAILAAMNIAEDYFKEKETSVNTKKEVEERSERLLNFIHAKMDGFKEKRDD
jgi:cell division protein ZapA